MAETNFRLFQKAIPTNVITGFLGVGKTTAIQQLLKTKPPGERWAVLINEFGKVGVDSHLMQNNDHSDGEITIREVPGGCMCCAAGLPMKVALNHLIGKAKPDRLLIEPSGLGHPEEVIAVLSGEFYQPIIDLRATLTLVDARHMADAKYREHETFQQQLQIADLIVANKSDMYGQSEIAALKAYLNEMHLQELPLQITQQGKIYPEWLKPKAKFNQVVWHGLPSVKMIKEEQAIPQLGYLALSHQHNGWYSYGWRFKPKFCFDYQPLISWLEQLKLARLKAVLRTTQGFIVVNQAEDKLIIEKISYEPTESRIEIITDKPLNIQITQTRLLELSIANIR